MPVTLQVAGMKYKDGNVYKSVDCLKGDSADISIFAPDYADISFPVADGKLCTHDGRLYKANQAIAAAESWTAAHWTATTIEAEMERKFGVSNLKADCGLQIETDMDTGKNYLITEVYGDTIAPNYSDLTFPIKKGQYCLFNRKLWIANTEIATQEGYFNRNHWTQVDVGASLESKEDKPDLEITFSLETDAESGASRIILDGATWAEFVSARTAGKTISATFKDKTISATSGAIAELTSIYYNATSGTAFFTGAIGSSTTPQSVLVIWDSNGNLDYTIESGGISDVRVNGSSVVQNGIANIPYASQQNAGVFKAYSDYGVSMDSGWLKISTADAAQIKAGSMSLKPVGVARQHVSTFYGLAKAAGDTTQSQSSNAVGTYTETAQSKISQMLDAPVSVSGTTPTITAKAGVRYICGECSTLTITAPASGCIDVTFTSGSTPTVLTVNSAKANTTVKWVGDFDPTSLEANTQYEINVMDGEWGMAVSWT